MSTLKLKKPTLSPFYIGLTLTQGRFLLHEKNQQKACSIHFLGETSCSSCLTTSVSFAAFFGHAQIPYPVSFWKTSSPGLENRKPQISSHLLRVLYSNTLLSQDWLLSFCIYRRYYITDEYHTSLETNTHCLYNSIKIRKQKPNY